MEGYDQETERPNASHGSRGSLREVTLEDYMLLSKDYYQLVKNNTSQKRELSQIQEASEQEHEQTPEPHQRTSPSATNVHPSTDRKNHQPHRPKEKQFRIKNKKNCKHNYITMTSSLNGQSFKRALKGKSEMPSVTRTITNFYEKKDLPSVEKAIHPKKQLNVYLANMRSKLKRRLMGSYLKDSHKRLK